MAFSYPGWRGRRRAAIEGWMTTRHLFLAATISATFVAVACGSSSNTTGNTGGASGSTNGGTSGASHGGAAGSSAGTSGATGGAGSSAGTSGGTSPGGAAGSTAGTSGATGGAGASAGTSGATGGAGSSAGTSSGTAGTSSGTAGTSSGGSGGAGGASAHVIKHVFVIMEENNDLAAIMGSSSAPYINGTLLPMAAQATSYFTHVHPSEPNYVWLEAGNNLMSTDDSDPNPANEETTTDHLVSQLVAAGHSWKVYAEGADGMSCPLVSNGTYAVKHIPQLFFSDVTDNFSSSSMNCISHIRPFTDLATDLAANQAPDLSFIVPNLCDDMHGNSACTAPDIVAAGDSWLQQQIPMITGSSAYTDGGVIFVVWDEGANDSDGPIPFIALGNMVKPGYSGSMSYTHSSTLRTVETIFGVPFLRDAANATDLSDLFMQYP